MWQKKRRKAQAKYNLPSSAYIYRGMNIYITSHYHRHCNHSSQLAFSTTLMCHQACLWSGQEVSLKINSDLLQSFIVSNSMSLYISLPKNSLSDCRYFDSFHPHKRLGSLLISTFDLETDLSKLVLLFISKQHRKK